MPAIHEENCGAASKGLASWAETQNTAPTITRRSIGGEPLTGSRRCIVRQTEGVKEAATTTFLNKPPGSEPPAADVATDAISVYLNPDTVTYIVPLRQ